MHSLAIVGVLALPQTRLYILESLLLAPALPLRRGCLDWMPLGKLAAELYKVQAVAVAAAAAAAAAVLAPAAAEGLVWTRRGRRQDAWPKAEEQHSQLAGSSLDGPRLSGCGAAKAIALEGWCLRRDGPVMPTQCAAAHHRLQWVLVDARVHAAKWFHCCLCPLRRCVAIDGQALATLRLGVERCHHGTAARCQRAVLEQMHQLVGLVTGCGRLWSAVRLLGRRQRPLEEAAASACQ